MLGQATAPHTMPHSAGGVGTIPPPRRATETGHSNGAASASHLNGPKRRRGRGGGGRDRLTSDEATDTAAKTPSSPRGGQGGGVLGTSWCWQHSLLSAVLVLATIYVVAAVVPRGNSATFASAGRIPICDLKGNCDEDVVDEADANQVREQRSGERRIPRSHHTIPRCRPPPPPSSSALPPSFNRRLRLCAGGHDRLQRYPVV